MQRQNKHACSTASLPPTSSMCLFQGWFAQFLLRIWLCNRLLILLLWLHDLNIVGEGLLGACLPRRVMGQHDLHFDAKDTCMGGTDRLCPLGVGYHSKVGRNACTVAPHSPPTLARPIPPQHHNPLHLARMHFTYLAGGAHGCKPCQCNPLWGCQCESSGHPQTSSTWLVDPSACQRQ